MKRAEVSAEAVLAAMRRLAQDEWTVKATLARINQAGIARALAGGTRSVEGVGRLRMALDSNVFHYWGQRLGYECWRDPQFLREFERDNPEVRVKSAGTRTMVGWRPTGNRQVVRKYEWAAAAA